MILLTFIYSGPLALDFSPNSRRAKSLHLNPTLNVPPALRMSVSGAGGLTILTTERDVAGDFTDVKVVGG